MTVDDCIEEYVALGSRVFGKPRHFHQLVPLLVWMNQTKYRATELEATVVDILHRRGERDQNGFKSYDGLCRIFVFAYKKTPEKEKGKASVEAPYIFRSYDHYSRTPRQKREAHPRNPGRATQFNIWEVARATTAAPFCFDPFVTNARTRAQTPRRRTSNFGLPRRQSELDLEDSIFVDGGFGAPNNPTEEACYELETSKEPIGSFVSIGTGRKVTNRFQMASGTRSELVMTLQ